MFANYFKIALRNLLRHRGHPFINVAGLALGLTCCLVIFRYVAFEYSFDRFNTNFATLYRVTQTTVQGGGEPYTDPQSGYALGPALAQAVPEVVRMTRIHPDYEVPVISNPKHPEKAFEERAYYADPEFLDMFSFPLVSGDPAEALAQPGTLLLSESAAAKYFGPENPLGKVLEVAGWIRGSYRVSGVFQDVPTNSHLQFDVLLPMMDLLEKSGYRDPASGWIWANFSTYVQLREDANLAQVEKKLTDVLMQNRGEVFRQRDIAARLHAQPLRDVHLNDAVTAPMTAMGSYRTVYFFTLIGVVTLLIALINYVNLSTARALDRAREVGVRKAIGAQRRQLVNQFLFETALTNFAAIVLAAILAELARPVVNDLAGTQLEGVLWTNSWFWFALLATFCMGTLLAGLYPAFVLSAFRPAAVLKRKSGSFSTRLRLRQSLVVVQFTISIAMVAGTIIVYTQLNHVRNLDKGIDLEHILTVPGPRLLSEGEDQSMAVRTFIQQLRQISAVRGATASSALPGQGFSFYSSALRRESADPTDAVGGFYAGIDTSFTHVYGLSLIAGTGFEGISDLSPQQEPRPAIVNETAIRAVGFDSAAEALNQTLSMASSSYRIVGVVRDFNWSSAHTQIEPAIFGLSSSGRQLSLKVSTENLPGTIESVERIYTSLFPGNPFNYGFANERFEQQYRNDERFARLFSVFSALAIAIACLGLFGLVSSTTQRRTKEIGVRKVLGASVGNIVLLLSQEFSRLVLIAFVVASPIAYIVMKRWLDDFAYRIELGPGVFLLAGILGLAIALATVSYQSVKAALADPVESLRYE